MGLLFLISKLLTSIFGFLYPAYYTYKVRSNPLSAPHELERWSEYWVIIGLLVGAEIVGEWAINWVPFYYEFKAIFVIWLSAPATQGSTYLYSTYVKPFLRQNEHEIDQGIASATTNLFAFLSASFSAAAQFIVSRLSSVRSAAARDKGPAPGQPGNAAANGPLQGFAGVFQQYAPAILTAGAQLLNPGANKAAAQAAVSQQTFPEPNASGQRPTSGYGFATGASPYASEANLRSKNATPSAYDAAPVDRLPTPSPCFPSAPAFLELVSPIYMADEEVGQKT